MSADGTSWTLVGSETIVMSATAYVGLAVVSMDPARAALASFANVRIDTAGGAPSTSPSAWTNTDVGNPTLGGRGSEAGGTFSVTGAGTDIGHASDQFHFMHQRADGDIEIVARVEGVDRAHIWSKAGVMIRGSLSASAAHVFMTGTVGRGWAFQRRPVADGPSVHSPGSPGSPPGWVKLVRIGNDFSGYESTDGASWELVGTETISMPHSAYLGLAVTSHHAAQAVTATFTSVSIRAPTRSNQPPTVTLTAPASGTTFLAPGNLTLTAAASDPDGTVSHVAFYINNQRIDADDPSSPHAITLMPAAQGTINLTAIATDNEGAEAASATATVTVVEESNTPPTVSITSPTEGAVLQTPGTILINAAATDSNGTITKVEFYNSYANSGGVRLIGTVTSSPYSLAWRDPPVGAHVLVAVAYDNGGALSGSVVSVVVSGTGSSLPTLVVFTPSPDHASLVTSYSVAIRRVGDPITALPAAAKNLGKPTPLNNQITVDISDIVNPLSAGSYYAIVTAIGSSGSAASSPSPAFTK